MKETFLGVLACPHCHQDLDYSGLEEASIQVGFLTCPRCTSAFKITGGIPRFIEPDDLTGLNHRFARIYDRVFMELPPFFEEDRPGWAALELAYLSDEIQS